MYIENKTKIYWKQFGEKYIKSPKNGSIPGNVEQVAKHFVEKWDETLSE